MDWTPLTYVMDTHMWKTSDGHNVPVPHSAVALMTSAVKQMTIHTTPETTRSRFPQLMKTGVPEIELALGHTFRDRGLLAKALTHGSGTQLALVGDAALQVFLGEKLWLGGSFPTAATVDKGKPATHTYAVPEGAQVGEANTDKKVEPNVIPCSSPKDMRCKLLACCNHEAYARTCVKLGISKMLCYSSATLQESLGQYTRDVERTKTWRKLMRRTAPPKVIGDTFLACVGAVLLDSHFSNAIPLMQQHVSLCAGFFTDDPPRQDLCVSELHLPDVTEKIFVQAIQQAGTAIDSTALSAPPMETRQAHFKAQVEKALQLNDFRIYRVDGGTTWGLSPRSVQLRPHADDGDDCDGASSDNDSEAPTAPNTDPPGDQGTASTEEKGPVYCEHCEMWLNGPSQWYDHKIGRKHKKNIARGKRIGGPVGKGETCAKAKVNQADETRQPEESSAKSQVSLQKPQGPQLPASELGGTEEPCAWGTTFQEGGGWTASYMYAQPDGPPACAFQYDPEHNWCWDPMRSEWVVPCTHSCNGYQNQCLATECSSPPNFGGCW